MHHFQVLTSAEQAKTKLNAHFECLRQCVNEALSERLATLLQSVDDVVSEAVVPLDHCQQEIQQRVNIAVQILDTGQCNTSQLSLICFLSQVL